MNARQIRTDIKLKLIEAQVSMTELARHLHIPLSRLSNWLNGWSDMPEDMEIIIAQFFKDDY